jgi:hypothetical protein
MLALIDWILNLFRSEDAARAFVAAPEQAMRDAGIVGVTAAQLSSVAATAVPGMVLGDGDPIVGLQRAVANQYGIGPAAVFSPQPSFEPIWAPSPAFDYAPAPTFAPSPTFAPETNTELASRNTTDLASNNEIPLLSPRQDAGANAQQGGFNLGFGDITLGDKTSQSATNGGVVVGEDANGDILSGDGAVLGDANAVTNGDIRADQGSNVATGQDNVIRDSGTTMTAGADAIAAADSGAVIKGAENHNGTSIGGGQTTTTVSGSGNTAAADGRETTTTVTTTEVTSTTTTDSSDNSVLETTITDSSTHDYSDHALFDASRDTTLLNSELDNSDNLSLASGNQLLGFYPAGRRRGGAPGLPPPGPRRVRVFSAYRVKRQRRTGEPAAGPATGDRRVTRSHPQHRRPQRPRRSLRAACRGAGANHRPPHPGGDRRPTQAGQEPVAQLVAEYAGRPGG